MRVGTSILVVCVTLFATGPNRAQPPKAKVVLMSAVFSPGIPLAETRHPAHGFTLSVDSNARGEGAGKLTLNLTPPNYDEYGDFVTGRETDSVDRSRNNAIPPLELDCAVEFVKAGSIGRINQPPITRSLFCIKGPKITSTLFFATGGPGLKSGRLLVQGKDQRVEYAVDLNEVRPVRDDQRQFPPCHPGCFPAGTTVVVPGGTWRIETIRAGDTLTTINPDGQAISSTVEKVFTTTNQLIETRTDRGTLICTAAQPLCLAAGGLRPAGDLKPGDRIWQWRNGQRAEAVVRAVVTTDREVPVFNLILTNSAIFVAGDFLARGKPPAEDATPKPDAPPPQRTARPGQE